MSKFSTVPKEPEDPIYGLQVTFKKDERPSKINLSIGVFPGSQGKAFRFQVVDKAEEIVQDNRPGKDYLPIDGLASFCEATSDLVFGQARTHSKLKCYTAQTVGSTAALHVAGKFLAQHIAKKIFIPDPTWVNHRKLFESCGLDVAIYPYRIAQDGSLHLDAILAAIESMPEGACIVLQASCHNPTGIDPKDDEWKILSQAIKTKKLLPFFDIAYQGVGRGLEEDARSIRIFFEDGHELFVAASFAKNLGLYSERVGALLITCEQETQAPIASQIRKIIRSIYSSPPSHGAHIANCILTTPDLYAAWQEELKMLRTNLASTRKLLADTILRYKPDFAVDTLLKSTGLFSLCGLSQEKVFELRQKQSIYLCDDSRINVAAIRPEQIEDIAKAITTL